MTIKHQSKRWLTLDVFRGFTVSLMILVNTPGSHECYSGLTHSIWNGCTVADLVFPFFIWIMGVTAAWVYPLVSTKVSYKMLELCGLGLFLNAFPFNSGFAHFRFYGVLQRLAICYGVCCISLRYLSLYQHWLIVGAWLLFYFWLLQQSFLWNLGPFAYLPGRDIGAWLDQVLWPAAHLYAPTYDPEGLLSTVSSCVTVLLGALFGQLMKAAVDYKKRFYTFLLFIFLGWVGGAITNYYQAMNKILWSSSYVLWTMGCAVCSFALIDLWIKYQNKPKFLVDFMQFLGRHALLAYILHVCLFKLELTIYVNKNNIEQETLREWIVRHGLSTFTGAHASFVHAVIMLFLVYSFIYILDRVKCK